MQRVYKNRRYEIAPCGDEWAWILFHDMQMIAAGGADTEAQATLQVQECVDRMWTFSVHIRL